MRAGPDCGHGGKAENYVYCDGGVRTATKYRQAMIDIKAHVHDKFSVEFKVGFVVDADGPRDNDFTVNTWLFIPNSLDINSSTYGKKDFYRDVKSNVRLITPEYSLSSLASGDAHPLELLRQAIARIDGGPTDDCMADYEYRIKMFSAIARSAIRDAATDVRRCGHAEQRDGLCMAFVRDTRAVLRNYRSLGERLSEPPVPAQARHCYSFGDEFLSHIAESYSFDLLPLFEKGDCRDALVGLLESETSYKRTRGYVTASADDPAANRLLVYRHNILKKYVSSELFIRLKKKRDGQTVRQIYYSIAAGIAMVFATVVAFAFQRKFGNFSGPLFVALVVSYMLKDRIKELMRYYFAHRVGRRYFDNKASIDIKGHSVGSLREGMDFISEEQVPRQVIEMRGRSPLVEAENRLADEKIILYRKAVYIDAAELARHDDYRISGIHDIMRIHINRYTQKMDDPQVPLRRLDGAGGVQVTATDRCYYLNIIMQFSYGGHTDYRHFRLTVTRDGIIGIERM